MKRTPSGVARSFRIYIALMDDPVYKQSSRRVADSLQAAGYEVTLIGGKLRSGSEEGTAAFRQVRIACLFKKGIGKYVEMNIRLFLYMVTHPMDLVCAVNLDTIVPCWLVSTLRGIPRVYDARELFTELAEVVARPRIQKVWLSIERSMVPRFPQGYAVCRSIADELHRRYGVDYAVVRNMTVLTDRAPSERPIMPPYLLYQGAVNHGRGLDVLLDAMREIPLPLVICGTGNYMRQCTERVRLNGLDGQVIFTGPLKPAELRPYTDHAFAGINLVEREGLNQYYSLPNKLFDYIHSGVPQVTMDYPEYRRVQEAFEIAILIPDVQVAALVTAVSRLLSDSLLYERLKDNCQLAKHTFNWQAEAPVVIDLFRRVLTPLSPTNIE